MLKKKSVQQNSVEIGKPSISVKTVFTIVGALFSVLVFALWFFRYNSASPFYDYYNKKSVPATSLSSSVETNINKSASGKSVELNITESQLSEAICASCDSFPLKKGSVKIRSEGVIIGGKTSTAFWGVSLEIVMKPKIENGQVVFDLAEFKAAGVSAPPKITETYSQRLKDAFKNIVPNSQSLNITEVHSLVGSLLIIGTKK